MNFATSDSLGKHSHHVLPQCPTPPHLYILEVIHFAHHKGLSKYATVVLYRRRNLAQGALLTGKIFNNPMPHTVIHFVVAQRRRQTTQLRVRFAYPTRCSAEIRCISHIMYLVISLKILLRAPPIAQPFLQTFRLIAIYQLALASSLAILARHRQIKLFIILRILFVP